MLTVHEIQTTVGVLFSAIFAWPNAVLPMWKQSGQKQTGVQQGRPGNV